jgi:hypothetical protein
MVAIRHGYDMNDDAVIWHPDSILEHLKVFLIMVADVEQEREYRICFGDAFTESWDLILAHLYWWDSKLHPEYWSTAQYVIDTAPVTAGCTPSTLQE